MKIRVALVVLFLSAGVSVADVMTLPLILDSGWDASVSDPEDVHIVVDDISRAPGNEYVLISITKNFDDINTPVVIDFQSRVVSQQPFVGPVDIVRISGEDIFNGTGVDWTRYHWEITNVTGGTAVFADPGNFSVAPFDTKNLTVHTLEAFGGQPVFDGTTFAPGQNSGPLDIVTVADAGQLVGFTLVQYPIPEPATIAVLVLGGLVVLGRRRRRRRA